MMHKSIRQKPLSSNPRPRLARLPIAQSPAIPAPGSLLVERATSNAAAIPRKRGCPSTQTTDAHSPTEPPSRRPRHASSHPSCLHAAALPAAFQSPVGQMSSASISNTSASFPLECRVDALTQAHSAAALDRVCDVAALRAEMARFREHVDRQLANMQENFEAAAATYSQSLGPALLDEHQIWANQFELEQELSELRVEVDRLAEWSSSGSECEEEWEGEDIEEQGQAMEAYVDADYAKGTLGLREGSGESGSDSDDVESE